MYYIEDEYSAFLEVKRSKFYSHFIPYNAFCDVKDRLKMQHPKARHIVWAYRYLNDNDQIIEDLSDDGEPKNSSAPPILDVMRGNKIVNCAILVVRYFGGIKLGIGGLVKAYGSSANKVIKTANLLTYKKLTKMCFFTPFSLVSKTDYIINKQEIKDIKKEFDESGAKWCIMVDDEQKKFIKTFLIEHRIDNQIKGEV